MLEATTTGIRPAGYERPRIEAVLSARDLEREVMTGVVVISRADA